MKILELYMQQQYKRHSDVGLERFGIEWFSFCSWKESIDALREKSGPGHRLLSKGEKWQLITRLNRVQSQPIILFT